MSPLYRVKHGKKMSDRHNVVVVVVVVVVVLDFCQLTIVTSRDHFILQDPSSTLTPIRRSDPVESRITSNYFLPVKVQNFG